ncbi:MAG TPA: DUF4907 domain-containing protein, partial [Bacteroidia bacterium]|nr:DUF4907 domain-containing protein [Bacteroidia bacterium]
PAEPLNHLSEKEPGEEVHTRSSNPSPPSDVELKLTKEASGWVYDIYISGKKSIHQPVIPAVPGNQNFASEKDARVTGELMAYKIKHGITPPSISSSELDSLHIVYLK